MDFSHLIDFFYKNWTLYLILLFDIYTEYDNTLLIQNINNNEIYYKKIFDSYLFNFIYILMPFYNIGIKIAQSENDREINFTNMIKLNLLLSSLLSYIAYYSQTYYFKNMDILSENFSIQLVAIVITSNSFLGSLNGYLIGKNDNSMLINFNIIYMISVLATNRFITMFNLVNDKIIYTKNLPIIISCSYLIFKNKNLFDLNYLFTSKIKLISYGIELIIRNIITLFGLNINNYATFRLSKMEIKTYEIMSGNLNNFVTIYTPLSTIIQKNIYQKIIINNICIFYGLVGILLVNLINYYFWKMNFWTVNLFNLFHFLVFTNEAKNISYNNVKRSIRVLSCLVIFKYIMIRMLDISTATLYYRYIIIVLLVKIILNSII